MPRKPRTAKLEADAKKEEFLKPPRKTKRQRSEIVQRVAVKAQIENPASVDPLANAQTAFEIGGLSRIEREAEVLMIDWAIRFPLLKPLEFLTAEKGYSVAQANAILHETGGSDDWELKRTEIQNKMTETVIKRHVDQMAEFNDMFIKGAKVSMAKAIEMLSKLGIDAVKDEDGKLMIDPKTKKPIYRGFRSIDLLNITNSLKAAQEIYRRGLGISDGEGGMAQLLEKVTQLTELQKREINVNNTQINLTVNPAKKEAEQKIENFIREMNYDDIRAFVEYHKKNGEIVDAEVIEGNSDERKESI